MGWFSNDDAQSAADQYQNADQQDPSKMQELVAGAASFEAMKAYENHYDANGDHDTAKEVAAAAAGAFLDREGQKFAFDREAANNQAMQQTQDNFSGNQW